MDPKHKRLLLDIPQAWVLFCEEALKAAKEWQAEAIKLVEQNQNDKSLNDV